MKIFISWSGERSKAIALALRDWLPLVLHYVDPWLSEADIDAGQRWADAVAKELDACNFGVLCVTRENIGSPWVLFEAGALAKSLEGSRVIPLLLDLDFREISGPLAQFQAKKVDRSGILETVQSVNNLAQAPVPDERYKQLFDALWPDLEKKAASIPKPASPHKQSRPQTEVLEELVAAVRTMEGRLRDGPEEQRPKRRHRHLPMIMHELGHMLSDRPGDPINVLIAASVFREDAPWLYELGMEAYRAATAGKTEAKRDAMRRFTRALEATRRGPFGPEDLGIDFKMHHMMLRELEYMMVHESELAEPTPRSPSRKKPPAAKK